MLLLPVTAISFMIGIMSVTFPGFSPEARKFLHNLSNNNNREWFQAHKATYEEHLRTPLLRLVTALNYALEQFSPGYSIEPRKAIYRIYRDVRFSKDKNPYKTHAAAIFPPQELPKHATAGYYFHFSADELLVGGGVYAPGSSELQKIRQQIAENPAELRNILKEGQFKKTYGQLEGEQLKRTPRGFLPDHPAADLLVYKQFLAGVTLPSKEIETSAIGNQINRLFRIIAPLIHYLNRPFQS